MGEKADLDLSHCYNSLCEPSLARPANLRSILMAEVQAFRGFRYDLARVGNLSDVVAPPYDVIDPALQQTLYDRSPYNAVRLILNKESSADTEHDNRYTRAAQAMRDWTRDGILAQDSARSLYVYEQE